MNKVKNARGALVDSFGRTIDYLRLSITDRCNLRCLYCMPPEGVKWMSHDDILRFEELLRLCRILASLGISAVKVTGGEPLVRRGAVDLVRELKAVNGIKRVTLTSNGVLLAEYLEDLADAGLEGVNISLDTLDKEKFRRLSRAEGFGNIIPALDRALELGLKVKINCVPLAGFNEDEIVTLAGLAEKRSIALRFIELMPLGAAASMKPLYMDEVVSLIEKEYGAMTPVTLKLGNGPAAYYRLPGFAGYIGLIGALSRGFCKGCNRLRLTASGVLKPCLSSDLRADLRSLVRGSATDEEIAEAIIKLVAEKPAGHSFNGMNEKQDHEKKEMFRIGG